MPVLAYSMWNLDDVSWTIWRQRGITWNPLKRKEGISRYVTFILGAGHSECYICNRFLPVVILDHMGCSYLGCSASRPAGPLLVNTSLNYPVPCFFIFFSNVCILIKIYHPQIFISLKYNLYLITLSFDIFFHISLYPW